MALLMVCHHFAVGAVLLLLAGTPPNPNPCVSTDAKFVKGSWRTDELVTAPCLLTPFV